MRRAFELHGAIVRCVVFPSRAGASAVLQFERADTAAAAVAAGNPDWKVSFHQRRKITKSHHRRKKTESSSKRT